MSYKVFQLTLFTLGIILINACSSPECIRCENISGYANTTYCRDTYETTLLSNDPDWKAFTDVALSAGCTEERHP
ncbi:MAG: hypothetical protein IAE67_01595 [Candidatus Competibacteraceae bacterium]|nr:hypothetical protein [Candidatus Competibacteraceae bacterium]